MESRQVPVIVAAILAVALSGCARGDKKEEADRTVRPDEAPRSAASREPANRSADPNRAKPSPLGPMAPKRSSRARRSGSADRATTPPAPDN